MIPALSKQSSCKIMTIHKHTMEKRIAKQVETKDKAVQILSIVPDDIPAKDTDTLIDIAFFGAERAAKMNGISTRTAYTLKGRYVATIDKLKHVGASVIAAEDLSIAHACNKLIRDAIIDGDIQVKTVQDAASLKAVGTQAVNSAIKLKQSEPELEPTTYESRNDDRKKLFS